MANVKFVLFSSKAEKYEYTLLYPWSTRVLVSNPGFTIILRKTGNFIKLCEQGGSDCLVEDIKACLDNNNDKAKYLYEHPEFATQYGFTEECHGLVRPGAPHCTDPGYTISIHTW